MSIYPDAHRPLRDPDPGARRGPEPPPAARRSKAAWDKPALTTYRFQNHAVRTEGWRYIRYANGDEELYDEASDPYEWSNLARDPRHAAARPSWRSRFPSRTSPTSAPPRGCRPRRRRRRRSEAEPGRMAEVACDRRQSASAILLL